MPKFIAILCLVFTCLISFQALAQNHQDFVFLKNGSVIVGKLLSVNEDGKVTIRIKGGSLFVFTQNEVLKIESGKMSDFGLTPEITFKEKGAWALFNFGFNTNGTYNSFGSSLNAAGGYQFNPRFRVGLGTGIDSYNEAGFFPFFGCLGGDIKSGKITPIYQLNTGYAIGFTNNYYYEQVSSGFLGYAGLGLRFNRRTSIHYDINFGLKMQKSTVRTWWSDYNQKVTFLRWEMKFAIGF